MRRNTSKQIRNYYSITRQIIQSMQWIIYVRNCVANKLDWMNILFEDLLSDQKIFVRPVYALDFTIFDYSKSRSKHASSAPSTWMRNKSMDFSLSQNGDFQLILRFHIWVKRKQCKSLTPTCSPTTSEKFCNPAKLSAWSGPHWITTSSTNKP